MQMATASFDISRPRRRVTPLPTQTVGPWWAGPGPWGVGCGVLMRPPRQLLVKKMLDLGLGGLGSCLALTAEKSRGMLCQGGALPPRKVEECYARGGPCLPEK